MGRGEPDPKYVSPDGRGGRAGAGLGAPELQGVFPNRMKMTISIAKNPVSGAPIPPAAACTHNAKPVAPASFAARNWIRAQTTSGKSVPRVWRSDVVRVAGSSVPRRKK